MDQNSICSKCHNPAEFQFRTFDYNRCLSREGFNYYRCISCGLVFILPIPDNLDQYYGDEYYEIPANPRQLTKKSEIERYKIEIIMREKNEGRLLEIGSAYGSFAYLAKQANFDVTCIEMDSNCCAFLRDVVGVSVVNSNNPAHAISFLGEFDVIALWHVIEHVPEPWELLRSLIGHCSMNGIIVIATPNPESLQFKLFKHRWTHLDAPRHLQLMPLRLLKIEMDALDMDLRTYTTNDQGGLGWNTFGWRKSFANYSKGFPGIFFSVGGKVVSILARSIERKKLNGSTYTAIFRKRET